MDLDKIYFNCDSLTTPPKGENPIKYSSAFRRYHRLLWFKNLPSESIFELEKLLPPA